MIEALDGRIAADRGPGLVFPSRRFEPERIVARAENRVRVVERFERRLSQLLQPRQPVSNVLPEFRRQPVEVLIPAAGQLEVWRLVARPEADRAVAGGGELAHRPARAGLPRELTEL